MCQPSGGASLDTNALPVGFNRDVGVADIAGTNICRHSLQNLVFRCIVTEIQ
jgi:hypothetical protein